MAQNVQINERYFGDELTRHGFISHMEAYIKQLLLNPKSAVVDDYLKSHGFTNEKALKLLLQKPDKNDEESAVLIRKEQIKTGEDGKDIFCVTYKLPRKDYKNKMRRLYVTEVEPKGLNEDINEYERLLSSTPSPFASGEKVISQCIPGTTGDRFAKYVNNNDKHYTPKMFTDEEQMVKDIQEMDKDGAYKNRGGLDKPIVKETDCAFAMQAGGNNPDAGQYVTNGLKGKKGDGIVRRTILMNEDQFNYLKQKALEEATASTSDVTPAGELAWSAFGDAETNNHKNICADPELMKGGVAAGK